MYNSEQKIAFIRDYAHSNQVIKTCEHLFDDLGTFETNRGADICTMDAKTLSPVIETIIGLRVRSRWRKIGILRDYAMWCLQHGVEGACDGMLHVAVSGTEVMKTRMVANPIGLQHYLDDICDQESYETNDNVTRVIFWLLYGGVETSELQSIRESDVDFTTMSVHCGAREIPIYREAVPAFLNCVRLDQFARFRSEIVTERRYTDRSGGDILIRGLRGVPSLQTIRINMISRRKKDKTVNKDLKISPERVRLSGLFYRLAEAERNGIEPDFVKIAKDFMDRREYNTDDPKTLRDMMQKTAKAYREDYECWKLAFSI